MTISATHPPSISQQVTAERLENTPLLVRQVADELRMDAFQFSRTFRRIHGLSPSAFLAARA